jgi:putative endonuclease
MIDTGRWGEAKAAVFLQEKGYKILATNYRHQKAEIDIIAQKSDCIVAVEVKTRTNTTVEKPFHAIHKTKQRNLIKAINFFVRSWSSPVEIRMDAISVIKQFDEIQIEHLQDAFPPF